MSKITSQDVARWVLEQMGKAHQSFPYVDISVSVFGQVGCENKVVFSIWHNDTFKSSSRESIEECFDIIQAVTPKTAATEKRERAAKLLAEADQLEATT